MVIPSSGEVMFQLGGCQPPYLVVLGATPLLLTNLRRRIRSVVTGPIHGSCIQMHSIDVAAVSGCPGLVLDDLNIAGLQVGNDPFQELALMAARLG